MLVDQRWELLWKTVFSNTEGHPNDVVISKRHFAVSLTNIRICITATSVDENLHDTFLATVKWNVYVHMYSYNGILHRNTKELMAPRHVHISNIQLSK